MGKIVAESYGSLALVHGSMCCLEGRIRKSADYPEADYLGTGRHASVDVLSDVMLNTGTNLFLRTRGLCLDAQRSGEDHLTEFIAGALTASAAFREAYGACALQPRFGEVQITGVDIVAGYEQGTTSAVQQTEADAV